MDKATCRGILPLVNDRDQMDRLEIYVAARIEAHRDLLETQRDEKRIIAIQGAVAELRRIKTLRDEVIKGAE